MKVTFVYPGVSLTGFGSYNDLLTPKVGDPPYGSSYIENSYGIELLGGALRDIGIESDLIDLRQEESFKSVEDKIKNSDSDFIAISILTPDFDTANRVASISKKYGKIVVAGGIHTFVCQEDFLSSKNWDFIFVGESEFSFQSFFVEKKYLQKKNGLKGNWEKLIPKQGCI